MSVPIQIPYTASTANGVTTSFPYSFKIASADDLVVEVDGAVVTTGYSVTGAGVTAGGNVIFVTPPSNGSKVVRYRKPQLKRTNDFQQFGDWAASTVNGELDSLWLVAQYLEHAYARSIKLPVDTADDQVITEDATARANMGIGFDTLGKLKLYVLQAGTSLIDLAASTGASLIGFIQAGAGAVLRTVRDELRDRVSVKQFGAVGNGVADDSSAIAAAEVRCNSLTPKGVLFFPAGHTFTYNGSFSCRVSISGYGATLKQLASSVSGVNAAGVILLNGLSNDVTIAGLTIDANNKTTGIYVQSCTGTVRHVDVAVNNAINLGFGTILSSNVLYRNCRANGVDYYRTGFSDPADGFYTGGGTTTVYEGCEATDVERICFVSDREGSAKQETVKWIGCHASNAHDCDDSATEFNAGFWAENTVNAYMVGGCTVSNISGNPGQTSGRVHGVILSPTLSSGCGHHVIDSARISGGTTKLNSIKIANATNAAIHITDVMLSDHFAGIQFADIDVIKIKNLELRNGTYTSFSSGGVVITADNGVTINEVHIDGITESGATYTSTDAATINIIGALSGVAGRRSLFINNATGTMISRSPGAWQNITISNSDLTKKSGTYPLFDCHVSAKVSNTKITYGVSGAPGFSFGTTSYSSTLATYQFDNVEFVGWNYSGGAGTGVGVAISTGYALAQFNGCVFKDSLVNAFAGNATTKAKFTGCTWRNTTAGMNAIMSNAAANEGALIVQSCSFTMEATANNPIKLQTNHPKYAVFHGNTYSTAALSDIVGTVLNSQVNNVAVP